MPLIEIINITLLAFSVGLLALMGISYLVYRYKESSNQHSTEYENSIIHNKPKEFIISDNQISNIELHTQKKASFQLLKTQSNNSIFQQDKFLVVNKNVPSLRKTHSPKFIHLVNYSENE